MNSQRTACNPTHIDQFLDETLSAPELITLERHLSVCEQCQSLFDSRLSQIGVSSSVADILGEELVGSSSGVKEIATRDSLSRMNRDAIIALAKRMLPRSDNPAMLGKLGEFEILEPLGAGGMGIVFKGYDHELNRYVAVKVLSPNLSIVGAAKQRFIREAQSAAGIVSPFVVPIHAVSVEDEIPYLVMSYIPGQNLQEYLDEHGALTPSETIRILHQVASGLAAAHERGVIHRDIKPANILLERNVQRAVLTDFGLARAADDATLTHSGLMAGTPNYMSPEQSQGDDIDARSDLFSLGCVMYTMLVGHPPFRGPNAYAIMQRIANESPRSMTSVQASVPEWMDRLVGMLIAKNPSQRIGSSQELVALLAQCQLHLEHPSMHAIPDVLKRNARRLMSKRLGVVMAFLAVFLVLGSGLWFAFKERAMTFPANDERATAISDFGDPIPAFIESDAALSWPNRESQIPTQWSDETSQDSTVRELELAIDRIESPTMGDEEKE